VTEEGRDRSEAWTRRVRRMWREGVLAEEGFGGEGGMMVVGLGGLR